MKSIVKMAMVVVLMGFDANAQEKLPTSSKKLIAEYKIYSGELGDEQAATKTDRKLAVEISGQAAKEIFDSIYPDAKVTCSSEEGERLRGKKNLWCIYQPSGGYRCFLGFNLRTGDSIPGASC